MADTVRCGNCGARHTIEDAARCINGTRRADRVRSGGRG